MDLPEADSAEDESDELFSDDEQKKEIRADVSQDASVLRSETPLSLFDSPNTIMPTDAVIPSTPLSLLPFLNKINEQWSSDLETPQAQQPRTKLATSSTGGTEKTPRPEQRTPDVSSVKSVDKIVSDSPVIASRATRRRSKRCIFRSSISIDPLAVTNNEDITASVQAETPAVSDSANSVAQDDTASAAISNLSPENALKDYEPRALDKSQDTYDEEFESCTSAVPDNLNTSTQDFFSNVSFSKIDELCSDTFVNRETMETGATRCNYERNIESIDRGRDVGENGNVGFSTARGAAINVSKQALFKAKRLFADAFDADETQARNYESSAKRNSNEEKNRYLPSTSFANNVSVNVARQASSTPKPLTEQLKSHDKVYAADCKESLVNKRPGEEVDKVPTLFSTASDKPINISKEALLKAKALLADESDNTDDDVLMNYCERSPADKNSTTVKSMAPPSFSAISGGSINVSGKSLAKARTLFAKQSDTTVKLMSSKIGISANEQCRINTSNMEFCTARDASVNSEQVNSKVRALYAEQLNNLTEPVAPKEINNDDEIKRQQVSKIAFQTARGKPIDISEQALSKAKALFAEHLDDSTEPIIPKETNNYNEVKRQETKVSKIGFQTARGTPIDISEQALSKAKALFAEHLDDSTEPIVPKEINNDNEIKRQEAKVSKIGFQTARGKPIDISEQALSKAKALFAEHLDDSTEPIVPKEINNDNEIKRQEAKVSKIGFQTARGKSIDISEQALSKAKALFAEHLDDSTEPIVPKEINNDNEIKRPEAKVSKIGFQTARGKPIDISEQALSKAKALFAEHLDDSIEPIVLKEINNDNEIKRQKAKVSKIGFQTARGKPIDISEQALSKAKALFAEHLDDSTEPIVPKKINNDDEIKRQEAKVSKIGFQTARGKPIDISEQALSKAKALFAEHLDDSTEPIVPKKINNDDEIKRQEAKVSKIGFQTARGKPIDISEQALSKAKALFAEHLDDSTEPIIPKEINNDNEIKRQEAKVSKIGFQTARGKPIDISEQALSKAKALFAEHLDDSTEPIIPKEINNDNEIKRQEAKVSKIGFQTARGKPIDISEQALSKAKALFAEHLDDSTEPIIPKEINNDNEIKRQEAKVSKIGFQTARGKPIDFSEQALSKAKALFAEHLDDTLEIVVAEKTNVHDQEAKGLEIKMSNIRFQSAGRAVDISEPRSKAKVSFQRLDDQLEPVVANKVAVKVDDKVENRQEVKIPSIEFQTGRGTSINISEQALSRAKALFADQLDPLEMDIRKNNSRDDERIKKRGELQAASGQEVPVPNNAASTARELFFNDRPDESNNSDSGRASLQKRKLSETNVDESTPLGRYRASDAKKTRLSSEFPARKLFFNNPNVDTDNDENRDPGEKRQALSVVDPVLGSPRSDAVESTESDAAGSPVIGRQSLSRKRKSLGHQRDEYTASRADKKMPDNENAALRKNIVQGGAACGKIEDDKLDTETREPNAQASQERAGGYSTESSEYGDTQVMMDFIDQSTKILQDRLAAALEQEAIITAKRRRAKAEGSRQSAGHLYRFKQINSNGRLSLREIGGGAPPVPRSYQELVDRQISPGIQEITASTAATYRFCCSDFYGNDVAQGNVHGIEMADGVRLILDENGYAGVWEFLRAFLAGPGVNPSLVPARWVENHYRWIVWKLASMDRMKFGTAELPRALTPSHVMAQLKYRYDREIDRSQRPAIRRILEKDDVASKRMVLCVSSIVENNNVNMEVGKSPRIGVPRWRIELTDGWYSTNACIDIGMVRNISTGRIREGTKLMVSGAELLNCDQGFYPLEAPADVCLRLHTNSTRRARWDTKLGYAPRSGPIPIKLRNVCPSGGLVGEMTIIVARVYPMLYHEKTASGDSIVRNAKSEEKAQARYEQQCWSTIEAFYANAEDFQRKGLSCGTDDMAIQLSEDYENFSTEEPVSKKRHDELLQELRQREERFKQRMQSKLRESLPGPRQVSQLLKVRVCDENANAVLSVWSPGEEVVDALKEGACVSLCNVMASGRRGTELQLTARRSAIFKPGKMRDAASYPVRVCTSLRDIASPEFAPPYGEFDTVGLVCSVGPAPYGMKDFDAVHLAYREADSSESSYFSILFWQGIASYGYTEILTVGSIVACSNLEWRRVTSWNVPAAYCTDRSTFTRNPRRSHLYEPFENLRNLITDPIKYAESCTFGLNVELQKKSTPTRYAAGKNTPTKMYSSTLSADKKLVDYTSPLATPKLGMGNSSNYVASNPSIRKRLEKLQYYGEPPELSSLVLQKSKRASLDFRSPIPISDVKSMKETSKGTKDLDLSDTTEKH